MGNERVQCGLTHNEQHVKKHTTASASELFREAESPISLWTDAWSWQHVNLS